MGGEAIAVLGTALDLPLGIDSAEKLFECAREKRQLSRDLVQAKRYLAADLQHGRDQAWKIKNPYAFVATSEESTSFDTAFFQYSPKIVKNVQIEQLAVLQAVYYAIEDAGLTLQDLHRTTTGVFAGAYSSFSSSPQAPDETVMRGLLNSSIADQVSYWLGTHGPSVTMETACSSSLTALSLAVAALQRGECDVAIVAGSNHVQSKDFHLSLQACGVLVDGPSAHPFNEDGPHGFLRGEGTGAVVLRRLSEAEACGNRILCEIAGTLCGSAGAAEGVSQGSGRVYESPCTTGMIEMMTRACRLAEIPLSDVDYIECHATGTAVGDMIELTAVGAVYGEAHSASRPLRLASLKSNIGHAEMAAGMFSFVKTVASVHRRVFLPTAGVTTPRKDFDWKRHHMVLQQEPEPFPEGKRVIIGINSFGIGGGFAHVLVREYKPPPSPRIARSPMLLPASTRQEPLIFPLSAYSLAHLTLHAKNIAEYLRGSAAESISFTDMCATMALHRTRFPFRRTFIATSTEDLALQLEEFASKPPALEACTDDKNLKVLFVLTGQGSQWAKNGVALMKGLPVYRDVVQRADALFRKLSGWSILEKIEVLDTDDMRDTMYAQPITFLVQVGLLEALQSFNVFPDLVMGHSAGEVSAAYAAGLLTLEEAVMVVYHRSEEQQKLAGSGRMLAVGLGAEEVTQLLQDKGLKDVEIACVNSPNGTVLAGPEPSLTDMKQSLPQGTSSTFIPGNIAFHSKYVEPILESMRRRLSSFLEADAKLPTWALPFISTVTGKVEKAVDAQYFVNNVRQPVLFRKAVEVAYSIENPPEVVIEIGPHRTLIGPLMQTVGAMEQRPTITALSLLNRKEDCLASFLQGLGALIDRGLDVNLKGYYDLPTGRTYHMDAGLPKHPYIKKDVRDILPALFFEQNASKLWDGPTAGIKRMDGETWMVEVSDRTCPTLMDHKMGTEAILPGAWYIEMVLEAFGLPCTVTDIEFKSKLTIPRSSAGDIPALVFLVVKQEQDGWQSFVIKSTPLREKFREEPILVEHCVGRIFKSDHLLTPEGEIRQCLRPRGQGLMHQLELRDLGEEGLKALIDRHSKVEHKTRESFYDTYSAEGKNDYGPHFQGVTELRVDPISTTVLGKIEIDNSNWEKEGGVLLPEILDSVIHVGLYYADTSIIYYAGGYEAIHALRKPATKELYACYVPDREMVQVGRRKRGGDYLVYDGHGNLVLYKVGSFYLFAMVADNLKTVKTCWQPMAARCPLSSTVESLEAFAARHEKEGTGAAACWSAEQHARLSDWVKTRVEMYDTASGEQEEEEEGAAVSFPAVAGLDTRGQQVVDAIARRKVETREAFRRVGAGEQPPSPAKATDATGGAKMNEEEEDAQEEEEGKKERLSEEDMAQLLRWSTSQVAEASAAAEALASFAKNMQIQAGGGPIVMRVLELAESEGCPSAVEALSHLTVPDGIKVEAWVGSHSLQVLRSLITRLSRRTNHVVARRVRLTEGGWYKELSDLDFQCVIVNDWARTGVAAYGGDEEGGGGPADKSKASIRDFTHRLTPFLARGAHLIVRGFNPTPAWVRTLSEASARPLAPDSAKAEQAAIERAANDWADELSTLTPGYVSGPLSMLIGAVPSELTVKGGRFLLAAHSQEQADDLTAAIQEVARAASVQASVVAVIVDDNVTDDDIAVELKSCWSEVAFDGVIFAAGLDDRSLIGEDAHSRLARFLQAVIKTESLAITHTNRDLASDPTVERPFVYVLTEGCYAGKIRPNQGVLQGFVMMMDKELRAVVGKHIDMATTEDVVRRANCPFMQRALQAMMARFRQLTLSITHEDNLVPRALAVDTEKERQVELGPSDPRCYYATPQRGAEAMKKAQVMLPGVVQANFQLCDLPPLADDEVTVNIEAAALNFRDVMISLSLLPEQSYERSYFGKTFGMEAAGIVSAVGKNVTEVKVGDRVVCAEPSTFTNRLNCKADRVGVLAPGIRLIDAASTQSVYNTCQHALINLARIRKGDRVLVHSAAGGIGHAAISICQYVGAVIYATAGTEEKRELVRKLGVQHVYDSRSTSWYEDVMAETKGKGVDVVLNSLAGIHQRLGVQALSSSGRFLEIGKVDIFSNSSLGLLAFRKNISFFAIDMDRMALDDPELTRQVTKDVAERFAAGDYKTLPVTTFPMGQIKEALELMKTGKHVGKVVLVNHDDEGREHKVAVEKPQTTFRPDVTYLVTGGAGGFGQRLITYAVYMGARHFVVSTTKSDLQAVRETFRDLLERFDGVVLDLVTCDTSKREDVERLVQRAKATSPPCKAVFHVAGIHLDVRLPNIVDREDFAKVACCKALGAWYLSEMTMDMDLETFVAISSVSSRLGGMGLALYSPANAYIDALIRYRQSLGLPARTYNMGSLIDVGMVAKNASVRKWQQKMGLEFLTSWKALEVLEAGLVVGFEPFSMSVTETGARFVPTYAEWHHLIDDTILVGTVDSKAGASSVKDIVAFLADEIKAITQATEVNVNAPMVSLGLDSFSFIELSGRIQKSYTVDMNSLKLTPEKSLKDVALLICKLQRRDTDDDSEQIKQDESVDVGLLAGDISRADVAKMLRYRQPGTTTATDDKPGLSLQGRKGDNRVLFLLGATGIAGAHILRYVIKIYGANRVYCLVRGSSSEAGFARIRKAMVDLGIWKDSFASRIVAVAGDMAKPRFGMLPKEYEEVRKSIEGIVNAAGARTWDSNKESLDCNVRGLMTAVELARESGAVLHFVSSCWLDIYEAGDEKDREALVSLPYVLIKRRGEEILRFAAKQCHVACNVIRLPLLGVNSRMKFQGDLVLFLQMQAMYLTKVSGPVAMFFPYMASDAAAKDFVRQMQRMRKTPSQEASLYRLYSAGPLCEYVTNTELCDLADEVTGESIMRGGTLDDLHNRLCEVFTREVIDALKPYEFLASVERAGEALVKEVLKKGPMVAVQRTIKTEAWKGGRRAFKMFRDYVRARPELIKESVLHELARDFMSRQPENVNKPGRKGSEDESENTDSVDDSMSTGSTNGTVTAQ